MELSQNKKLTILAVILFLLSAALAGFLGLKYRSELAKQKEAEEVKQAILIPRINTNALPPAKVGVEYRSEIIASLLETHAEIEITAEGLPEGLTFGNCVQEFDSKLLPAPNTLKKCFLQGIPAKAGLYHLTITTGMEKGAIDMKHVLNLSVTEF